MLPIQTLRTVRDPRKSGAGDGWWRGSLASVICLSSALLGGGCGTTKTFTATEQLLVSDAVDTTVAKLDFRPLSGQKVFLDTNYMPKTPTGQVPLVHTDYVASSLRQQLLAAGVYVCEKRDEADLIVEARLGAMGFDGHTVTYGLPASNSLTAAASTLAGSPVIPLLPELSFAKKEAKQGAAKLALFAYERQTLQPVWQSGIARANSSARDSWVMGIGPIQYGTIYEDTRVAGSRVFGRAIKRLVPREDDEPEALVDYKRSQVFTKLKGAEEEPTVETAQAPGGEPLMQAAVPESSPAPLK